MSLDASSPDCVSDCSDPQLEPLFSRWRCAGSNLVAAHRADFDALLAKIGPELDRKGYASAADLTQVAANHAVLWHPGAFASNSLDHLIDRLGREALPFKPSAAQVAGARSTLCTSLRT